VRLCRTDVYGRQFVYARVRSVRLRIEHSQSCRVIPRRSHATQRPVPSSRCVVYSFSARRGQHALGASLRVKASPLLEFRWCRAVYHHRLDRAGGWLGVLGLVLDSHTVHDLPIGDDIGAGVIHWPHTVRRVPSALRWTRYASNTSCVRRSPNCSVTGVALAALLTSSRPFAQTVGRRLYRRRLRFPRRRAARAPLARCGRVRI